MTEKNEPLGFSGAGRHITEEDQIELTSVGVDIGSSTSHLVFSRLELERQATRYVIVRRTVIRESENSVDPVCR
jgi:ethanolamine utilization protein EutA